MMRGRQQIELKSPEQMLLMRAAGLVVARALEAVREQINPGVTTGELDGAARAVIEAAGAIPSFVGYGDPPFPGVICASVNNQVVHGIPGSQELRAGDVVSIDCGAILAGWHGDSAFTMIVPGGSADPADEALVADTRAALWRGIAAMAVGAHLNDIGSAVASFVAGRYGIPTEYGGHGIGRQMHQPPHVVNHRERQRGPQLRAGMCLAIEPMLIRGSAETSVLPDGWTVVSADGGRAAHWEHTVALHEGGLWVLTEPDGGERWLAPLGVTIAPLDA